MATAEEVLAEIVIRSPLPPLKEGQPVLAHNMTRADLITLVRQVVTEQLRAFERPSI